LKGALLRISDSLAFGATARHVYAVVDDAENSRKLFVKGKNNLATAGTKSLAYRFGGREVGADADTGQTIFAPHLLWEDHHVDVTASEATQRPFAAAVRVGIFGPPPPSSSDDPQVPRACCCFMPDPYYPLIIVHGT
jgi:hypothetical protein